MVDNLLVTNLVVLFIQLLCSSKEIRTRDYRDRLKQRLVVQGRLAQGKRSMDIGGLNPGPFGWGNR